MNVGFFTPGFNYRGTGVAIYDYANYNESILGNQSYIISCGTGASSDIRRKFEDRFGDRMLRCGHSKSKLESHLNDHNITHLYRLIAGTKCEFENPDNPRELSTMVKECIHCVFNASEPHGDVYAAISDQVKGYHASVPVVPHMISLPNDTHNLRAELNIPDTATVFGGYGGKCKFSIQAARDAVYQVAKARTDIYFLFANFDRFCEHLPNIIHVPTIYNVDDKVSFINTCDAMLWARNDGETFGIAIGEFSSKNKPVIAKKCGKLAHANILKNKGIWYEGKQDLIDILHAFDRCKSVTGDWNAYTDYTPEKVINIFNKVFLK